MIIGSIENAMLKRLDGANRLDVLGYTLRKLDSLPVDLDAYLAGEVRDFPAVWTVFGGYKKESALGGGGAIVLATYHLVVAAANLRNERTRRHGGGKGEVGSYQLAMDLPALLVNQDFGLPISALELGDCSPLYTGGDRAKRPVSMFAIAFTTRFRLTPNAPAAITVQPIADFTSFNVEWDIPPHAPDGPADASAHLTLNEDA